MSTVTTPKEFRKLLHLIADKVKIVYGDGGYDSRSNFNYLFKKGIDAAILPRKSSSTLSRGSPSRAKVVRTIKKMGLESWKEMVQYGKRWRVEILFSALKRVVGEVIRAKKLKVPDPGGSREGILLFPVEERHSDELNRS